MSSIFGDDGVDDLFNDNINNDDLPSDDEQQNIDGENLFHDDEADAATGEKEGVPIKLEPKKRAVRNPRPRLTVDILSGPRGIHTIEDYFKDIKFKGKGHEKTDLDEVMRRMQHWAHRMYPNYKFDDVLTNIERLGKKKALNVHMSRYRLGLLENLNVANDANGQHDNEEEYDAAADEPFDEFDALLGEQIAISKLAPRTPAQSFRNTKGATTPMTNSTISTPSFSHGNVVMSTPHTGMHRLDDTSDFAQPLPPSQPATPSAPKTLTAEQIARIEENRRLAKERLRAKQEKMKEQQGKLNTIIEN